MTIDQIVKKFKDQPHWIRCGAGKLSKRWKCSKEDIYSARNIYRNGITKSGAKILIFDLETSPLRAYVWRRWKQNVSLSQTISEWFMLSWSAKWLGSTEVMSDVLTGREVLEEDDNRIVSKLWRLIDEADIIVAHNGDSFDVPKMNSRFILNGLKPPRHYLTIDTKRVSAKQFGFSSNKLDALAMYFGIPVKLDTDFELWANCMKGDDLSLRYMQKYNEHDVEILEDVYLRLRPWVKNHPNVSLYNNDAIEQCHVCGSTNLVQEGYYHTIVGKYETFRCKCGALSKGRKSILDKNKSKYTLSNIGK
jgi:hypothetical protein